MGKVIRSCRCGNTYSHAELESPECPVCGRVGNLANKTVFHRCNACAQIEGCPPKRKESTAKSGVCMYYKCPELVRYKHR